ncbi:hypothetical protein CANTEDRAFT_128815 [Yamadazyma tenuis ATCC 10573]|uniref:Skg3/CAF120-like PH-like domain-containing protein n=1 Tax=Candida tenuis (strain ATCC 10573 / BCRC 21748 / CBS 615 / JCM 9827 / NBRC 10315 / NRRL Y-1498 / VKM Y-70) TaxID=590646 RepID=G3AXI8_CANTC|nr:uncharacterized protein CANTEDRAFT_128815 [Yamadazyma tenuis ATCC 10573]EGV66393.1 hypothetical protein CANTEDRAFT_128815 [Yamadazyma tenuis ATCC 10573]
MHIPILTQGKDKQTWTSTTKSKNKSPVLPAINTSIPDYKRPPPVNFEVSGSTTSSSPTSISNSRSGTGYPFEEPTSPSSITRRQLSEKIRQTPSSYVRNSRVFSNDFDGTLAQSDSFNSLSNLQSSKNVNSFSNVLLANKSVPPELSPIVSLFNSHNFRTYYAGEILLFRHGEWDSVSSKLTGNELSLWYQDETFNPTYYNLFDYNITLDASNWVVKFSNDLNESFYNLILRATCQEDYVNWVTALFLSNYEKLSLNEAFTAVVLSMIGPKLSDIHTLLSKKKYPKFEWCNIRLPQINHKWLRCYVAIHPSSSKKSGRIEIYQSEKTTKKNLICYITGVTNVYNIFPENVNMIEYNSIMKLNGEVYVNSGVEHLFLSSQPSASSGAFSRAHRRATSGSSFFSASSSPPSSPKIKSSQSFINTNYIYMMPDNHPGVQAIETMIRNYIPILDAFKLYGRPKQLNSDKYDKHSLLFGLPSLPHYEYLSFDDAREIVDLHLSESQHSSWSFTEWNNAFKHMVEFKMANENYKGNGNISVLYKSLELDDSDLLSIKSLPDINFPQGATNEFSPSPVPGGSPPDSPSIDNNLASSGFNIVTTPSRVASSSFPDSPNSTGAFRFDNFENYNNIDKVASPVTQLGELDEPIKFHPYRQRA